MRQGASQRPRRTTAAPVQSATTLPAAEPTPARVELGDHQTAVVDMGTGAVPTVMLHSLGLDWKMARDILPTLAGCGRVIAYDLRLHGAATAPSLESYTLERCAEDLRVLLDMLEIDRARIVGFSLGGAIAQLFALTHPRRVDRLVLVATMMKAKRATYLRRAKAAETDGMEAQIPPTLRRWFRPATVARNPWYVDYAREKVRRVPAARWARYWREFSRFDVTDRLASLAVPTSVIAAQHDRSTPPSSMAPIAALLPDASFAVIPGAPHMVSLEQPRATAEALTVALDQ